jgi:hypothetical protein
MSINRREKIKEEGRRKKIAIKMIDFLLIKKTFDDVENEIKTEKKK